jgi:hypothetical protein
MERRFLPALCDHGTMLGAFATKWEGWKNPHERALGNANGRVNVSHPDDIDRIDDLMGLYVILYEPSQGSRYVAYVGYSKGISTELRIRYGKFESEGRVPSVRSAKFPFAAVYISNQVEARAYEDDLIRYYCPTWNTKFHR